MKILLLTVALVFFLGNVVFAENPSSSNDKDATTSKLSQNISIILKVPDPMTRKEAFRASTGKIVFHYGEGIVGADDEAESLTEDGYPAIAVPGGKPGQVEVFVDRGIIRRKFTQKDMNGPTVGGLAANEYDRKFRKKTNASTK